MKIYGALGADFRDVCVHARIMRSSCCSGERMLLCALRLVRTNGWRGSLHRWLGEKRVNVGNAGKRKGEERKSGIAETRKAAPVIDCVAEHQRFGRLISNANAELAMD